MDVDNNLMEMSWNGDRNRMLVRKDLSAIEVITVEDSSEVYYHSPDEVVHFFLTTARAVFSNAGHPSAFAGWSHSEGFVDEPIGGEEQVMEKSIPLFCEYPYGWLPIDPASEDPLLNCVVCWNVGQSSQGLWTDAGFVCCECASQEEKK